MGVKIKTKILGLCFIFAMFFLAFSRQGVYASESNSELNSSYIYNPWRSAVNSPAAFSFARAIGNTELGIADIVAPMDVCAMENRLYIVCNKTNAIYILDADFQLIQTIREMSGSFIGPNTLNGPEGVFVNKEGNIYVADTMNQRIVVIDQNGTLIKEYPDPGIRILGEVVTFFPIKIAVDDAERIYVVGRNINRGIIELSREGNFNSFIGAPKVKASFSDFFKRFFMTKEQISRMEKFIPTEYNNITLDDSGFLYGTIGSVDADAVMMAAFSKPDATPDRAKPVVKLSPSGSDILFRRGNAPIIGELNFETNNQSLINDVAVRSDGIYSILDQRHGKVFSYDMYGNLLYVFGSLGKQNGKFQSPSALCYFGNQLVVADQISGKINIFSLTEYGSMLNAAVKLDYDGKFDDAARLWKTLVAKNSNLYLAYTGIGKMYYRDKDYQTAMTYFKTAYDYYNYDKSKEKLRKESITNYFPVIFVVIVGTAVFTSTKGMIKRKKRGEHA